MRLSSDTGDSTYFLVKEIKKEVTFLKNDYLEFKQEMRAAVGKVTSKGCYASDFFPADDNDVLDRFMTNDKDFEKRREALYLLVSGCESDKEKTFANSMLNAIFSRKYMATHIWPLGR